MTDTPSNFAAHSALLRGVHFHLLFAGNAASAIRSSLDSARVELAVAGCEVQADIVPGEPEKVIAETVKKEGINLLVMGAYGHSRIREFILGSTTTTMVRTCLVPVLMFR